MITRDRQDTLMWLSDDFLSDSSDALNKSIEISRDGKSREFWRELATSDYEYAERLSLMANGWL